jgi:molybdopterin molybdotransferase
MGLIPVDEAIARIVAGVAPLPAERIRLADALGRILAVPLAATRTQPPFPASAMDGFAIRAADVANPPATLKLIGMSAAGHGFRGSVGPGEAVRIFTGAPVPEGADAVLIQENADADGLSVLAREPVEAGKNVRPAGLDFREGDILLRGGERLGVRETALAAAMNHGNVPVRRRPRVAIIATGDELVEPGATPGPDEIVASNGLAIAAFVRLTGGEPVDLGIVVDDRDAIRAVIRRAIALPADIIVTLGGASVGEHDLVREALTAEGMALDFWKIAMRPGKPLMFGTLDGVRVLGLPGNPVSSIVCGILFLGPLLAAMLGVAYGDPTELAVLGADVPANDRRQDYLRAGLEERPGMPPLATARRRQDSSMLSVLAQAGCLIVRPPNAAPAKAGDVCRIIRLA